MGSASTSRKQPSRANGASKGRPAKGIAAVLGHADEPATVDRIRAECKLRFLEAFGRAWHTWDAGVFGGAEEPPRDERYRRTLNAREKAVADARDDVRDGITSLRAAVGQARRRLASARAKLGKAGDLHEDAWVPELERILAALPEALTTDDEPWPRHDSVALEKRIVAGAAEHFGRELAPRELAVVVLLALSDRDIEKRIQRTDGVQDVLTREAERLRKLRARKPDAADR